MRELLIKILARLEGTGLKDAAQQQREVAAATRDATRAAEQQRSAVDQQAQQQAKSAEASKKHATGLEDLKRASDPAAQAMQGLSNAVQGGTQSFRGLFDVGRASVSSLALQLGTGGTLMVALGAVVGAVLGIASAFKDSREKAEKDAKQLAESLKAVGAAAEEVENANLGKLAEGFAKLNAQADTAKSQLLAALDLSKQLADAETAANIAFTKAQVSSGRITQEQGDEAIRGFSLEKQLRDTQDPARRAAIEAQAQEDAAQRARDQEQAFRGRAAGAAGTAQQFAQDNRTLEARAKALQEEYNRLYDERARGNAQRQNENRDRRAEISRELAQIESDRAKNQENIAAAEKQFQADNAALIEAIKAREAAERAAAAAAQQAAKTQSTADKIGRLQTGVAQAEQTAARVQSANAAGAAQTKTNTAAAEQERIQRIVSVEDRRRAQADREIAAEIKARQGAPLPNFELPAEASRPGSNFDVGKWNAQQEERWRSGADLTEAEAARRATFDRQRAAAEKAAKDRGSKNAPPTDANAPRGDEPDTSLGGINRGRGGTATPGAGTIEVGGRPYQAPADTPVRERSIPQTPLRDAPAGTIEVRDAKGNPVDLTAKNIGQETATALKDLLVRI